jgi:glycosyltransferase involved in cell wall biosynthesis
MKISIIVPNYNTGQFLDKCIESIWQQSYRDFEIILVDAYSTDESVKIIEKYVRINTNKFYVAYKKPQGQSDAINTGMKLAHGEIVAYLNADDTYEQGCFDEVVQRFKKPETQWLYGIGKIIDKDGEEVRDIITNIKQLFYPYSYKSLCCVDYIVQPTVFLRRSFYQQVGEFNVFMKYSMDYEYWLRAGKISEPDYIPKHIANWRAHKNALSVNEYKNQARQALNIQKEFSHWLYRPIQYGVYLGTILLYRSVVK